MKFKLSPKVALLVEVVLTLFFVGIIIMSSMDNVAQEVKQYESGLALDYENLIKSYTTDFKMMRNDVKKQIESDLSFEEMNEYLQSRDQEFETAIGSDIYDGFSMTYKGGYARSWNYGDYSAYDKTTRLWYQTAQNAAGKVALTAPYVTFLDKEELSANDEVVVLTITQKYNNEISFCYDIKTFGINDLLSKRYNRYDGTFAIMYDDNGYILSSTEAGYYCHNVYQEDNVITKSFMENIQKVQKEPDKIWINFANDRMTFSYLTKDQSGNYYLLDIPFLSVVRSTFSGTLIVALILVMMELWIYYHMEKQKKTELELEKVKNISQMKQDFLARMSHDMRTPMNGILGLSELSKEENDINVLKDNLDKIYASGEYLLALINDTLDLQKIDSGKLVLIPQVVSTKELIASGTDMIRESAKEKGVQFVISNKNADFSTYIKVDPMRMKQIFVNLLSNAIKFTPQGGTVELGFEVLERKGNIVHDRITVTDTGIGMSREFIENDAFKPFSQEHNALTDSYAGSGMGLAIVKSLVEMMGATISVESELGTGTKFTIDIHFECVAAPSKSEEETKKIIQTKTAVKVPDLSRKQLLLAEDHPLNAEITMRIIKKAGGCVVWTKDGEECVETFKSSKINTYAAILMDIRMPNMDGLEAAKSIRSLEREDAENIPIIAMSANAYDEDMKKSIEAGMNEHLPKPVNPSVLYENLEKYCCK